MQKIIIAGGSGFLGQSLEDFFVKRGDEVFILSRKPKANNHIYWDGHNLGEWVNDLEQSDVLINLSGKCVDCRYNEKNKAAILSSRINSTNVLNEAILTMKAPPKVWINASSATIYVHAETQLMTESNGVIGDDFSMGICKQWEAAFFGTETPNTRKIAARISIVLGNKGGALPKIKMISRLGMGGYQGNGQQKVSWIHINDFCEAISYIIDNPNLQGPVNLAAPYPTDNKSLMKQIRQALKMPFGFSQSPALLELGAWLMGTETELLLKSRNVYPEKLVNTGFKFKFSHISTAVENLVS